MSFIGIKSDILGKKIFDIVLNRFNVIILCLIIILFNYLCVLCDYFNCKINNC